MKKLIKIFAIFFLIACSISNDSGYENEDVLMKYIESKSDVFFKKEYSIITVKSILFCYGCMPQVKISDVINYVQSVNNEQYKNIKIFIVTDGVLADDFTKEFLDNKNIQIIVEDTYEMKRYGLYHTHIHWFYVKNKRLIEWKYFMTNEDFFNKQFKEVVSIEK